MSILPLERSQNARADVQPFLRPRPRLSEVLLRSPEHTFESFAVTTSNVRATESAMRFVRGINPFVVLIGPSGWGKSHLLSATAYQLGIETKSAVPVISGPEFLADSRFQSSSAPLILDNAQDLVAKTRSRYQLQLTLQRRFRSGRPTLLSFTEGKVTRAIRNTLPNFRDWLIAPLRVPSQVERVRILRRMADVEGMRLSETLTRIMATRLEGNGRTFLGALCRLQVVQSEWMDHSSTLRACGILNPFLASNPGWDLRELIAEAAKDLSPSDRKSIVPFDLSLHVMLNVALLVESDVARFFRIEPGKAFGYANRFAQKVESDAVVAAAAERFVSKVVSLL